MGSSSSRVGIVIVDFVITLFPPSRVLRLQTCRPRSSRFDRNSCSVQLISVVAIGERQDSSQKPSDFKIIQLSSFHTCFGREFCLFQQYLSELNKMENLYAARIIRPSAFSHLTDNASCLHAPPPTPTPTPSPSPPHKNCSTLAFRFSWVLQSPTITTLVQFFFFEGGGAKRCILGDVQMANVQKTKYGY